MKVLRWIVLTFGLLVLGALAWIALRPPRAPATWLRVEAPRAVIAGHRVPVRVRLDVFPAGTWLGVDLHGATARREPRGFLDHGPVQRVEAHRFSYAFELSVPARDGLGYVYAVLFLSPSGAWEDRSAAATSALIPVRRAGAPALAEPIPVYDTARAPASDAEPVPAASRSIAALWLLSGLCLWRRPRRGGPRPGASGGPFRRHGSVGLAAACLIAALWELSGAEASLAAVARAAALESMVYFERSGPQRAATLALLALATGGMVRTLRRPRARATDLVRAGLWLYAGVASVSLLSLHQTDRVLGSTLFSVPVAQVVKFVVALAVFACALAVFRRQACATPFAPGGASRGKG